MIYFTNSTIPLPPYVVANLYYDNSRDVTTGYPAPHWWIPQSPYPKFQAGD